MNEVGRSELRAYFSSRLGETAGAFLGPSSVRHWKNLGESYCATGSELAESIRVMASADARETDASLQVYTGGIRDPVVEATVLGAPPTAFEALESWLGATFGNEEFFLVVNNLERWNAGVARRTATFVSDCLVDVPLQSFSVEVGLVAGKYENTPFGVHSDGDDLFIVHCHLGPGRKRMLHWDPEVFVEATGSVRAYFSVDEIRHLAQKSGTVPRRRNGVSGIAVPHRAVQGGVVCCDGPVGSCIFRGGGCEGSLAMVSPGGDSFTRHDRCRLALGGAALIWSKGSKQLGTSFGAGDGFFQRGGNQAFSGAPYGAV